MQIPGHALQFCTVAAQFFQLREYTANYPEFFLPRQTTEAKSNLELLQKQQKELEDENKKKKALVEQTLHERQAIATCA